MTRKESNLLGKKVNPVLNHACFEYVSLCSPSRHETRAAVADPSPSYTSTSSYKENICELPLGPSAMVHSALETIENVHGSLLYFMRSLAVAPSASQHHSFWFLLSLCSVVLSVLPLFFFTAGSDQSLLLLPVWPIGTPLIAIFPQRGLLSVNLLSSLRLNTIQSS